MFPRTIASLNSNSFNVDAEFTQERCLRTNGKSIEPNPYPAAAEIEHNPSLPSEARLDQDYAQRTKY